jgi:alcohol dehydrogenase YqhD (iron-dependent ADH family)
MENFIAYNPTSLHFGKGVVSGLGASVSMIGKRVLLVYGKGSIKENGIYNHVMGQLNAAGCAVVEYGGIKSNPVVSDVDAAAALGRDHKVDAVVAVGGGSVIDSAKFIAITIPVQHKAWDFLAGRAKPVAAVPLVSVLTLAATGSEMNAFAVVQNEETKQKPGYFSPFFYPRHSFLDPEYTFSVPRDYTAYGIVDLIAHSLEGYFGRGDASLTDRFSIAIIQEAMEYGPALLNDLQNYDLRARIMYAATEALNGLVLYGKSGGDWGVHGLGHTLSVLFDVPHGASLSIAYPAWMKYFSAVAAGKITRLGRDLFDAHSAEDTIKGFEDFFRKIGSPVRISELNISPEKKNEMLGNLMVNKVDGNNYKMKDLMMS